MTNRPTWYSQRFRPDGGITADGLRNQLGRPSLSRLTVLVREAAQNSWDARVSAHVDYRMELRTVGAAMEQWRRLLAPSVGQPAEGYPLGDLLDRDDVDVLIISDRGTEGLGGPTRSDVPAPGGRRNWLSFVLNSGDKQDTAGGGGTYGYGKGALYLVSRVRTVLIHTRFVDDDGRLTTRLIGATLGTSYTHDNVPYTGRHWWGVAQEDVCEPLLDEAAIDIAAALGLPTFTGDQTGTTIVVIDPDLTDPHSPDPDAPVEMSRPDAARYLADAAAWNLWPLTLDGREQRMTVTVMADGSKVTVPGPADDLTLRGFADAWFAALQPDARAITWGNGRRPLGRLGHSDTFAATVTSPAAKELGLGGAPHHIALMRTPDLVVQYLSGPAKQHPSVGYAGVFKAVDELDEVFAASEPPTHDSWNPGHLQGRNASYVRTAHRRLGEHTRRLAGVAGGAVPVSSVSAGSLSRRLGHLLAGALDPAAASGGRSGGGGGGGAGGGGRRRRPRLEGAPRFVELDGRLVLSQQVILPEDGTYTASCRVLTGDGSPEREAPVGAAMPTVIGWRFAGGFAPGATLEVVDVDDAELLVEPVGDAVVDITVRSSE